MEDWQREFPILTEFSNRKLFMRVGPLLIGLLFFKKIGGYSPKNVFSDGKKGEIYWEYDIYITIESLWHSDNETTGIGVFIDRIDYNISFKKHPDLFATIAEHVKYKYGNIINRSIQLDYLINILEEVLQYNLRYQKYNKHSKLKNPMFTYNVASILELELAISIYIDNEEWNNIIWQRINHYVVKNLNSNDLLTDGLTLGDWLNNLYSVIINKKEFLKCVEINCNRPDVKRLNVGEFVNIDKFKSNQISQKNWKDKISNLFSK